MRFCLLAALVVVSAVAQQLPVPDWLLYRDLYTYVLTVKAQFDRDDAQGINTGKARRMQLDEMGLTPAGLSALESIGAGYLAAHRAYLAQKTEILRAKQAALKNGRQPAAALQVQLGALKQKDDAMAQAHIAQLRSTLGDAQFARLDAFARARLLPGAHVTRMKPRL